MIEGSQFDTHNTFSVTAGNSLISLNMFPERPQFPKQMHWILVLSLVSIWMPTESAKTQTKEFPLTTPLSEGFLILTQLACYLRVTGDSLQGDRHWKKPIQSTASPLCQAQIAVRAGLFWKKFFSFTMHVIMFVYHIMCHNTLQYSYFQTLLYIYIYQKDYIQFSKPQYE